jgi:hypothetical protein
MAIHYLKEKEFFKRYLSGSFDKSEADAVYKAILSEIILTLQSTPVQGSSSRKLALYSFPRSSLLTIRETLDVILSIVRTRGLLRWLCLNLLSRKIVLLERAYFLSRFELAKALVLNFKVVLPEIRSHFRFLLLDGGSQKQGEVGFNDYVRAMTVGKIELQEVNYLACDLKFRTLAKRQLNSLQLLTSLSKQSKKELLAFLREYGPDEVVLNHFKKFDWPGWEFLTKSVKLNSIVHKNSTKSFDELATIFGSGYQGEVLEEVEIWHQRFLVKGDSLIEFDATGTHKASFVAGHWQFLDASRFHADELYLEETSIELPDIEQAIFLCGRADENWYHLLLDTLPRYYMFLRSLPRDIPVLIRDDLPSTSIEFLEKVISHRIIQLPGSSKLRVKKLHMVSARSTVFDAKPEDSLLELKFSPQSISAMADWIKSTLNVKTIQTGDQLSYFKRRSRQRRIINSSRIDRMSAQLGWQVFEDDDLLYRSQVKIFSNVTTAISPGGAMLANLIFMPKGSSLICLRSTRQSDLALWKNLANAVGVNYHEVKGIPTYHGKNLLKSIHSNYYISPRRLLKTLGEVMQLKA